MLSPRLTPLRDEWDMDNVTFSLLHHGPGLSEGKTLHGLIAMAPGPLF